MMEIFGVVLTEVRNIESRELVSDKEHSERTEQIVT